MKYPCEIINDLLPSETAGMFISFLSESKIYTNEVKTLGKIDVEDKYIARVKEVTSWAIDSGMYVIVNIHWDGGWWTNFPTDKENCMKKYKSIWTQLSNGFAEFGDKLVFESLNEEGVWDSVWNRYGGTTGKLEAYGLLNEINQTFVDVVRSTGGNNTYRHLLIAGYATDITLTCDSYFKMPNEEEASSIPCGCTCPP